MTRLRSFVLNCVIVFLSVGLVVGSVGGQVVVDGSASDGVELVESEVLGEGENVTINVDPSATYLHTNADAAGDAEPVALCERGIAPGDEVRLERRGEFGGHPDGLGMIAVFSGSDTLLSGDERDRVPDAVDAGADVETSPTFEGSEPTDIPEDFQVATHDGSETSVTVTVPEDATHLFVAALDNLYDDNSDGDGDFAVDITLVDDERPGDCPATGADGRQETVDIDPTATYLHTNADDANDTEPVALCERGIAESDVIRIERRGEFSGHPDGLGVLAVFSGSDTLLSGDERDRVPDAIDAGADVETSPTFEGGDPTDIPEDFRVSTHDGSQTNVTVTVPEDATHLFLAADDNLYEDNSDGSGASDLRANITLVDDDNPDDCPPASPLAPYTDDRGIVTTGGLQTAVADWSNGDISTSLLQRVVAAWSSGDPVD